MRNPFFALATRKSSELWSANGELLKSSVSSLLTMTMF